MARHVIWKEFCVFFFLGLCFVYPHNIIKRNQRNEHLLITIVCDVVVYTALLNLETGVNKDVQRDIRLNVKSHCLHINTYVLFFISIITNSKVNKLKHSNHFHLWVYFYQRRVCLLIITNNNIIDITSSSAQRFR